MNSPDSELSLDACLDRYRRASGPGSLVVVHRVDSTNRLARRIARPYVESDSSPPPLVLVAREQTAGRGRQGRVWVSPPGVGIYTSLLLSAADGEALSALPLRVPLALCRALREMGVDCGIKWPNDLVAGGRKLGGVLIEALAGGRAVIVGYGINGSQGEAELPVAGATSLRVETGAAPNLSGLAVDLAQTVMVRLAGAEPRAALVEAYRERCVHQPGDPMRCRLGGELVEGVLVGFDDRGRLRIRTSDGERVLDSAELLEAHPAETVAVPAGESG